MGRRGAGGGGSGEESDGGTGSESGTDEIVGCKDEVAIALGG